MTNTGVMICDYCGETFNIDDAPTRFECVGPLSTDGWNYAVCPHCGHDEMSEAEQCECCNNWVAETINGFCEHCRDDLFDRFLKATENITDKERNYLYEELDWDGWCETGPSA